MQCVDPGLSRSSNWKFWDAMHQLSSWDRCRCVRVRCTALYLRMDTQSCKCLDPANILCTVRGIRDGMVYGFGSLCGFKLRCFSDSCLLMLFCLLVVTSCVVASHCVKNLPSLSRFRHYCTKRALTVHHHIYTTCTV